MAARGRRAGLAPRSAGETGAGREVVGRPDGAWSPTSTTGPAAPGASGRGSRSGRSRWATGCWRPSGATASRTSSNASARPPVDGVRGRAVAPRAGPRPRRRRAAGSRRPTTSGRSPATSTATSSGCAPAVLATWDEAKRPVRALRLGHRRRARGSRRADAARPRARAGPARRDAGDGGVRARAIDAPSTRCDAGRPSRNRRSRSLPWFARPPIPPRRPPDAPPPSASCAPPAGGRGRSRRSCGPTSSRGCRPARRSSRASSATTRSVIPAIENAILAGQDIVFLGERGQAKTRLARLLVDLLDEWLPVVRGGELNDDPFAPVSAAARAIVAEGGDDTPIDWLPRDRRYAEKLATPDITIADLIGEVDPIRVAEGRYLSDELTLHYGLIPRANRGIFAINELPGPRGADPGRPAQHPRGARRPGARLHDPAAARPVRRRVGQPGGLHEPRPDHHAAQGPPRLPDPDPLPAQPRARDRDRPPGEAARSPRRTRSRPSSMPAFMEELVAELTHLARRSPEISQRSGVSVRVSVANMEVLEAAAIKRAVRLGEPVAAPRISRPRGGAGRRRPARSRSRRSARTRPRSGSSSGS